MCWASRGELMRPTGPCGSGILGPPSGRLGWSRLAVPLAVWYAVALAPIVRVSHTVAISVPHTGVDWLGTGSCSQAAGTTAAEHERYQEQDYRKRGAHVSPPPPRARGTSEAATKERHNLRPAGTARQLETSQGATGGLSSRKQIRAFPLNKASGPRRSASWLRLCATATCSSVSFAAAAWRPSI
jgi:hypothetical protein